MLYTLHTHTNTHNVICVLSGKNDYKIRLLLLELYENLKMDYFEE